MSFLLHQLSQLGMVAVTMACALVGTVGIIKLIKKIFPFGDSPQNLLIWEKTIKRTNRIRRRKNRMEHDSLKDTLREGIVKKSIQILRAHGKTDDEIKEMMLKDFSINELCLDKLLKSKNK